MELNFGKMHKAQHLQHFSPRCLPSCCYCRSPLRLART